ncbi:hypothetical protein Tco_0351925 [Tanacetum coccineum]
MSTMAENVISAGAANRPPMLERSQYDSWKSRMLLYIRCKEHGKHLLNSFQNGPFQFGTIDILATPTTPASIRVRAIDDLTEAEKIREACDIRETNIVLQGLPPDVYTLVKHHTVFKEIWDIVKFLIEDVKLTKDMHNSSFNQLYAYLRQHEVHANEVRSRAIGIATGTWANRIMGTTIANQLKTDDLDAFDSDYDEAPSESAVLMAKLSAYNSDVLSKVRNYDTYQDNNVIDQSVQEMQHSEQPTFYFEIQKKELLIKNDRLLEQIISQDIICNAMHSYDNLVKYVDMEKSYIDEYNSPCTTYQAAGSKIDHTIGLGPGDIHNGDQRFLSYQNEVNDIRAERIAKSANPLALLVVAQPYSDNYYQAPKPQRSNATLSSTRPKLALLAKYFKRLYKPTNNNLRTSSNSRNKTEDTTPRYNNDNQSGQFGNQRTMTVVGARETVGIR